MEVRLNRIIEYFCEKDYRLMALGYLTVLLTGLAVFGLFALTT